MQIVSFHPEYAAAFDRLNRDWIEQYFRVEPIDDQVLRNPQEFILANGGELWVAVEDDQVLGVCALLRHNAQMVEFTKLGVAAHARGRGIARALLRHCVERAHALGAHTLRIYTNTRLIPANQLYRSEGFVDVTHAVDRSRYARCDVVYDLPIRKAEAA